MWPKCGTVVDQVCDALRQIRNGSLFSWSTKSLRFFKSLEVEMSPNTWKKTLQHNSTGIDIRVWRVFAHSPHSFGAVGVRGVAPGAQCLRSAVRKSGDTHEENPLLSTGRAGNSERRNREERRSREPPLPQRHSPRWSEREKKNKTGRAAPRGVARHVRHPGAAASCLSRSAHSVCFTLTPPPLLCCFNGRGGGRDQMRSVCK